MIPIIAGVAAVGVLAWGAFQKGRSSGYSSGHAEGYDHGKTVGLSLGKKAAILGLPIVFVTGVVQQIGKELGFEFLDFIGLTDMFVNMLVWVKDIF